MGDSSKLNMPPGFRFYPTDEELVVHFLNRKATLLPCHPGVIPDLDLYPYDPWDLNGKAMGEGNKWYFYSRRTQNRITESGYWRPIDEETIYSSTSTGKKIAIKKYLVFYTGKPPHGVKTNWIMQEYMLYPTLKTSGSRSSSASSSSSSRRRGSKIDYSKWVVCRVYECSNSDSDGEELSCLDEVFLSLDDLDEISSPN